MKGIGGHTKPNNGQDELWLSPPQIISRLGKFDLDPCACPDPRPWPTAERHIALPEDGLSADWGDARVWLNPPYGAKTAMWMEKMAQHNFGTALIFARTEVEFWHRSIWPNAKAILFIEGRLYFHLPDGTRAKGNAGGPSALISYSDLDTENIMASGIKGFLVHADDCRLQTVYRRGAATPVLQIGG